MSKNLINILRSKLFSRSLPFYRRKDSSDEEQIRKSSKKLKNPEEGGEEQVRAGDEGAEGEGAEGDEGEFDYTKRISRRDRKRIRITNIFDPENTGEKPVHEWLDAKRIKSLGNLYEQFRNTHREENIRIDRNSKIILEEYLQKKFAENYKKCTDEIANLPFHLKEECEEINKSEFENFYNDKTNPAALYLEQMFRIYPPETTKQIKMGLRLLKIAEDNLGQGE